jgi:hypothetical protein
MVTRKKGSVSVHLIPLFLVVGMLVVMCCCCCSGPGNFDSSDYEDMFGECTDMETPFGTICVPNQ